MVDYGESFHLIFTSGDQSSFQSATLVIVLQRHHHPAQAISPLEILGMSNWERDFLERGISNLLHIRRNKTSRARPVRARARTYVRTSRRTLVI